MNARPVYVLTIVSSLLIASATGVATPQKPQPPADPTAITRTPRQDREVRPAPPIQVDAIEDRFEALERHRSWGPVIRVGTDYILRSGESVRDVFVIYSSADVEGYVRGDIVVVFGTLRLAKTAVVGGSLIVVGGSATVESGAAVRQSLLVVGGGLEAPPDFTPGREHVVIGGSRLAERVQRFVPWITEGLLLGRPLVPRLGWIWLVVAVTFFVSLAIMLMFLGAVRSCTDAIAARPLSTFLVGLIVLVLTGPVSVVLAASVIGIAVVPFVFCALVIAWIVGKVGVTLWVGGSLIGDPVPESRLHAIRSFGIGFALICLAYMVPVLGFVVWAMVGVVGLGASTLAFMTAFRRENPLPTKPVVPSPAFDEARLTPAPAVASPADIPPLESSPALPSPGPGVVPSLLAYPRAGFLERLAAFVLDGTLVLIAANLLDFTFPISEPIALLLAYHIGFWTWKGTTVGGIICQLRLVRVDGQPLRFVDALVRGLSSLFSFAVIGIGCLWILRDPERQSWHDKIAGTYVVKVPRNFPLP